MTAVKVGFAAMTTAAADVKASVTKFAQLMSSMDDALRPLRASWTGEASAAYQASKATWNSQITTTITQLNAIGKAVETSGEDYKATEDSIVKRW